MYTQNFMDNYQRLSSQVFPHSLFNYDLYCFLALFYYSDKLDVGILKSKGESDARSKCTDNIGSDS